MVPYFPVIEKGQQRRGFLLFSCVGASHFPGATGQTLYTSPTGGGTEPLTCPLSGQDSQTTNKMFYSAAAYLSCKRALPYIMSSICLLTRKHHIRKRHQSTFVLLLLRNPETPPCNSASPVHPLLLQAIRLGQAHTQCDRLLRSTLG